MCTGNCKCNNSCKCNEGISIVDIKKIAYCDRCLEFFRNIEYPQVYCKCGQELIWFREATPKELDDIFEKEE